MRVQARVLRTIDKVGGLDEYLLGDKPGRIKELGLAGWRLRWRVVQSPKVQARFRDERVRLGVPAEGWQDKIQVSKIKNEVEKVKDNLVQELQNQSLSEEQNPSPQDPEQSYENPLQDETTEEWVARTERNISRSEQQKQEENIQSSIHPTHPASDPSPAVKPIRLAGTQQPEASEQASEPANNTARSEIQDIMQANDSTSTTSKALGRLRGLFGR